MQRDTWTPGALVGALACVGIVLGSSGSAMAAGAATVDVGSNATFGTVLTDAQGLALYTFPQDQGSMSACDTNAECASVWPALTVPAGTTPTAGPGVTGTVGAAVQANGVDQVTYNGAPVYTFVGDSAPGQVSGNGVGGFTVVVSSVPPTSTPTTAPTTAPTGAPPATMATAPVSTPSAPPAAAPTSQAPAVTSSPASASASPAPSTAAAGSVGAPTPASASASPALASTGAGPGLIWIALAGVAFLLPGTATLLFAPLRRRRRNPERIWLVDP